MADVLNTELMVEACRQIGLNNVHIEVFDSLPSTSVYLSERLKSSDAPHTQSDALQNNTPKDVQSLDAVQLCVTDWQTNGNGRRGKTWVTERGNITFSMLVSMNKAPSELMGLSLVTGICVAESLKSLAGLSVDLKWPNDVLVGDKKLCGLLTELVSSTANATQIIVGIGINYKQPVGIEFGDYKAINLPDLVSQAPSRAALIADVCARVLSEYAHFEREGWSAFAQRWDTLDYMKGKQVRVLTGTDEQRAKAVGVDENGALLVEADGQVRAVYSGDVSLRLV